MVPGLLPRFEEVKALPEVVFLGGWHDTSVIRLHEVVKVQTKVGGAFKGGIAAYHLTAHYPASGLHGL